MDEEMMNGAAEMVAPEGMINTALLGKGAYDDKEEGEAVETVVTGTISTRDDGRKVLVIETIEGVPVETEGMESEEIVKPMEEVKGNLMESIKGNNSKFGRTDDEDAMPA